MPLMVIETSGQLHVDNNNNGTGHKNDGEGEDSLVAPDSADNAEDDCEKVERRVDEKGTAHEVFFYGIFLKCLKINYTLSYK